MKSYTEIPDHALVEQWNGGEDEKIVNDLREVGWTVLFQEPVEGETVPDYDEATNDFIKAPAKKLMVIVGPFRGQYYVVEAGNCLVYQDGNDRFKSWSPAGVAKGWTLDDEQADCDDEWGKTIHMPSPDVLKKHHDNDMY